MRGCLGSRDRALVARANEWMAHDPDPLTREELRSLIEAGDREGLASRFEGSLTFGTAGIRGAVGAGPNRINRAVVIRTTAGLAAHLSSAAVEGPVVLGFDARPDSRRFAEDAGGVLVAAGIAVRYFSDPTPTPLVAFAARYLGASAAVVITASHNPPSDNGYKVYGTNAAQIIPPVDVEIAAAIDQAAPAGEVPCHAGVLEGSSSLATPVPAGILDRYWVEVNESRPAAHPSDMRVVYTPLHGVGGDVVMRILERGGHRGVRVVPEQAVPDGSFPTVPFPNPEEPGALDLAIDLARGSAAELVLANDPDADRLAVAVPVAGDWRLLSGNEIGVLLGDHILAHHRGDRTPIVVSSVVSSPMLGRLAKSRGAHHEVTLTGFKWIVNAGLALEEKGVGQFVYGYEEALGYTVGQTVRDKDGISAALVFCDLTAALRQGGRSVLDRLAELWDETGVWASAQESVQVERPEEVTSATDRLAQQPPAEVVGRPVTEIRDYRTGASTRPPWLGEQSLIELQLGGRGRLLARPSGTEPKIKIYVDLVEEGPDHDPYPAHQRLTREAQEAARQVAGLLQGF